MQRPVRAMLHLLDAYHARHYLLWVRSFLDFLVLYRHYFPEDYAHSLSQIECGQTSLMPTGDEAYSTLETDFLKLVDTHLFPLPLEFMLEDTDMENRCFTIPVEPFGIDAWGHTTYEEMDLEWRLLFYLFGAQEPEDFVDVSPDEHLELLFAQAAERGQVDDDALQAICAQEPEPLRFLPSAIDIIDHDTGTTWLDATLDMSFTDALWRIDVLDALKEQYQEALAIQQKAEQFIRWLGSDLHTNYKEVIRVWTLSLQRTKQKQQEP